MTATSSPNLPPGRYRESALVYTNDPDRPRIRLAVNILVKRDVHVSVETIEMGRVRIASLRANPSLLELLEQSVILESRTPNMRITALESDLPFLSLQREPEGAAQRFRVDVGLDLQKLRPGKHRGVVRVHTDLAATPQIVLPVEITIAN